MNNKTGFYASLTVAATTVLFAIGIVSGNSTLSYAVCIFLSWGYILLACGFASESSPKRKTEAYGGIAFSCLYGILTGVVYFTQLSTVANGAAPDVILKAFSYSELGSFMFNMDLFGYAMLAISTFLVGLTIKPADKPDKWLKALFMIHGIFAPVCVAIPIANVFQAGMPGGDAIGSAVLLFWCCYFTPAGILSALHFKKTINQKK